MSRNDAKQPKRKTVMLAEELDGQNSAVLAAMRYYDDEITRENFILTNYPFGEVGPDDDISEEVEEDWPEQFRRATLIETPPASEKVQ
jgi:hypothetical protein